jgi:ankyrin repeat protein
MAAVCGNKDIVELLISKGADVTVEIMNLATQRGNTEIVELLHEHGAEE